MRTRKVKETDFVSIERWRSSRGLPPILRQMYAPNGFIVDGVAAGFLTFTDTSVALIENLVTNPEVEKDEREAALSSIIVDCEKMARACDCTYVIGISNRSKIASYARMHGFRISEATLYMKEL